MSQSIDLCKACEFWVKWDKYIFQEMEMGEKPKKAPEQTQMIKMGMLGKTQIVHYHPS